MFWGFYFNKMAMLYLTSFTTYGIRVLVGIGGVRFEGLGFGFSCGWFLFVWVFVCLVFACVYCIIFLFRWVVLVFLG